MRHPLQNHAIGSPDALFVAASGVEHTFASALDAGSRWSAALFEAGVSPGGRVAIDGTNCMEWVEGALGAWLLGATLVPLNARLPADVRVEQAIEVDADAVVAVGAARGNPDFEQPVVVSAATEGARVELPDWRPEQVATIFFTSGTTGRPKAVPHTWEQLAASAAASAFNLGVVPGDRWLCTLPLFHVGGLSIIIRSLFYGTSVEVHEEFDLDAVLEAVRGRATLASFVPTMLHRLLKHDDADSWGDGSLRAVLLGGGPATRDLLERAQSHGVPVFQTYGMTEAASQITTMPAAVAAERVGSAGLPIFGADVSIRDAASELVEHGESGTIWVRGPMITWGYLDSPDENARRFRDGWFDTGDFGRLDAEGFLWVETRRDDLIVSGGENVYPAEVESVLSNAPGVDEVAVIGREDDEWGQVVVAFVVGAVDVRVVDEWARQRLAGHQLPRAWHIVSELPRNASGKVLRRVLRET